MALSDRRAHGTPKLSFSRTYGPLLLGGSCGQGGFTLSFASTIALHSRWPAGCGQGSHISHYHKNGLECVRMTLRGRCCVPRTQGMANRVGRRLVGAQERPPGAARPPGCWAEPVAPQRRADRGRRDAHAKPLEFAFDALVAPTAGSPWPGGRSGVGPPGPAAAGRSGGVGRSGALIGTR